MSGSWQSPVEPGRGRGHELWPTDRAVLSGVRFIAAPCMRPTQHSDVLSARKARAWPPPLPLVRWRLVGVMDEMRGAAVVVAFALASRCVLLKAPHNRVLSGLRRSARDGGAHAGLLRLPGVQAAFDRLH